MRHLKTMKGRGTMTSRSGERVAVRYELHVYQDEIDAGLGNGATVPGMTAIRGKIHPVRCFGENGVLLEMQDGCKLRFFFADTQGSVKSVQLA
jgi:hypothetical protein